MTEEIDKTIYDKAFMCYTEIRQRRHEVQMHFLELGRLFKEARDNRYYKMLDYHTFEAFCASPELAFRRSTVYGLIRIYELYVVKLQAGTELLAQIGQAKLTMINPVVEQAPDEWLWKAKEMSRSDLREELAGCKAITPEGTARGDTVSGASAYQDAPISYLEFVRSHACITCGAKEAEPAHFPRTRGAGCQEHECIPLCRKCHSESHQMGFDTWLIQNKFQIFDYFYQLNIQELKCSSCGNSVVLGGYDVICNGCMQTIDDNVKTADMEMDRIRMGNK